MTQHTFNSQIVLGMKANPALICTSFLPSLSVVTFKNKVKTILQEFCKD